MRVKRYVVDSMPDAMQRIRSDLGQDAVILNSKEIRSGGFLGLFTKKKIEVIAAVDSESSSRPRQPTAYTPDVRTTVRQPVSAIREANKTFGDRPFAEEPSRNVTIQTQPDVVRESLSPQTHQAAPGRTRVDSMDADLLMSEVREMKRIIQRLSGEPAKPTWPPSLEWWKQKLEHHEFHSRLVDEILQSALAECGEDNPDQQTVDVHVRDLLRNRIMADPVREIAEDTRIVQFVGPTGVGKTTTIAKLAAQHVLKHQREVAMVTSDTYRIAAVEQLRTYANILDIPLEVVNSRQDLVKAMDRFAGMDVIFMDTAGRNFRNEMYVSELNSLLGEEDKRETYLVLSLTMKYKDMLRVADNFAKFQVENVLFTKLDETDSYGAIFNLLADTNYRPSYITHGQNVPEDIGKLNADKLIDLIMEEESNG